MDESLAKGYATQFLNWYVDDFNILMKNLHGSLKNGVPSERKAFEKFAEKYASIIKKFTLNFLLGGPTKHPFIIFSTYMTTKEVFEGWEERVIFPMVTYIPMEGKQKSVRGIYSIGEHALKRIFQRSQVINEKNAADNLLVVDELKFIPLWSAFWVFLKIYIKENSEEFFPIIPARNGLFLAKVDYFTEKLFTIHLRTFVGDAELSESQLKLKNELIKSSNGLLNSVLTFIPASTELPQNQDKLDFHILLNRILKFKDDLLPQILNSDDELKISVFNRKIINYVSISMPINIDILDEKMQKLPYRKFMNFISNPSSKKLSYVD